MVIAIIFTTYDQIAEKTRERKLASEEKKKRKLMKHKLE
jgi:restriction endonuclease S subunit